MGCYGWAASFRSKFNLLVGGTAVPWPINTEDADKRAILEHRTIERGVGATALRDDDRRRAGEI